MCVRRSNRPCDANELNMSWTQFALCVVLGPWLRGDIVNGDICACFKWRGRLFLVAASLDE